MLNLNSPQFLPITQVGTHDTPEDDARLDRSVNALMMVMALENENIFEGVTDVVLGFDELESELTTLQEDELRAAYHRVMQSEAALETALEAASAQAQAEIESAQSELESVVQEINRLRDQATVIENVFEPQYHQLATEVQVERQRAAELRNKAVGLNIEARSQFEQKVEMVLHARLLPYEERYAALEAERSARRQPFEQQITELDAQKREREVNLERIQKGQSEAQMHAATLSRGRAGEGASLYSAVRELLAAREKFSAYVARVEKGMNENGRMNAIAKRNEGFVERARLELDSPINAEGALARANEGQIGDAKRLLELALRGGLDESKANEIRNAITRAEHAALVQEWQTDLLQRAPMLRGMSTVNHYKELIASKSRESGYQTLSREMARVMAQAEKLAGQAVATRRRALEAHAAQYINSQNKFFSAQVMPDSGRVMIAVKKNGVWLRHALCAMVQTNGNYEIKTSYYERKTALDDQGEWDTRRARLEKRLVSSSNQADEVELQ